MVLVSGGHDCSRRCAKSRVSVMKRAGGETVNRGDAAVVAAGIVGVLVSHGHGRAVVAVAVVFVDRGGGRRRRGFGLVLLTTTVMGMMIVAVVGRLLRGQQRVWLRVGPELQHGP